MYTKRRSNGPRRYKYILITLFVILVIAVATVVMYPIEVIANLVSTCVQIAIIAIVLNVLSWILSKDSSNKPRIRTGRKSSVWITSLMNTIIMIIAVLVLFVLLFFVPQLVTTSITQYLIDAGQIYGIPILAFAMLSAMLVFLQLSKLVQKK